MNKKISRVLKTNMALYSLCLMAFVVAAFFVSPLLAIGEAVVVVLIYLLSRRNTHEAQQSVRQYMERYTGGMDSARSSNMLYTPLAMLVFDPYGGDILWANDNFLQLTEQRDTVFDSKVEQIVPEIPTHWLLEGKRQCPELVLWNHRQYRVFGSISHAEEMAGTKGTLASTYWLDVTEEEELRQTLEATRPVAAILMVDNYEDLMKLALKASAVRCWLVLRRKLASGQQALMAC